jgi:hypothetical protein
MSVNRQTVECNTVMEGSLKFKGVYSAPALKYKSAENSKTNDHHQVFSAQTLPWQAPINFNHPPLKD